MLPLKSFFSWRGYFNGGRSENFVPLQEVEFVRALSPNRAVKVIEDRRVGRCSDKITIGEGSRMMAVLQQYALANAVGSR